MSACVVDTNAIIYYLNRIGGDDYRCRFEAMVGDGAVISVISRLEVLSWPGYSGDPVALQAAEDLLSILREEPLTEPIVKATIMVRRHHRLKVPDAIVAATADILSLPLVTRNLADFKRVPGLVLLDPLAG